MSDEFPEDYRVSYQVKAARYDAIMAKVESMGHTGAVQLIDALAGRCLILQHGILQAANSPSSQAGGEVLTHLVQTIEGWDPLKPPVESPRRPQEPQEGIIAVQTPESDRAELVALLERYGRGTPGRVWALFHDLWGKAHDSPHYNKREWMELQSTLEKLLPDK